LLVNPGIDRRDILKSIKKTGLINKNTKKLPNKHMPKMR